MENIYAALLLHKVGGAITEAALEKVLKAAGATADKAQLTKLVAGLKDTDIDSLIASAAAAPVMAVAATGGAPAAGGAPEPAKKEEEPEVEEEPTGIGSLF
jgi:ribosomal protein L12E/L44/L45/RPP1/RPP2